MDSRSPLWAVLLAVVLIVLWALRDVVILVVLCLLLAVVLDPVVRLIQRIPFPRGFRIPRGLASGIVMLALVVGTGWLTAIWVPILFRELAQVVQGMPGAFASLLTETHIRASELGLSEYVDPLVQNLRENARNLLESAGTAVLRQAGNIIGNLGSLVSLALLPVLTFYLLAESRAVRASLLQFIPAGTLRSRAEHVQHAVNRALKSYVQGQTTVCLIMGTLVGATLALVGFPGAAVLGVLVGLAEILPFIGFWVATLAILLTGYSVSPVLALLGLLIYSGINTVNGYLILPRVMSRHLKMHPFVIMVSVLAGATLLGAVGVFIALPGAAVVQALLEEFAPVRDEQAAGGPGAQ
jgi:predicted PurR-regulated permease PerM